MKTATLTLIGLYNWDSSLFDGLQLPDIIVKEDFIDELLSVSAWQNLLYSDFELMKRLIRVWSSRRLPAWNKMLAALDSEYNPIHNYDRTETYTDTRNLSGDRSETASGSQNSSIAAFDSSALEPRDSSAVNNTTTSNYADGGTIEHDAHLYGNIGVTTTQQMISEELKLRQNDITNIIINEFISRFCLDVYN